MPIYEYRCKTCGHEVELIQKRSDGAPVCPNAHGELGKLHSLTAFHLKGGGWERDGYGRADNAPPPAPPPVPVNVTTTVKK
jgi:putative FmdB family regulatory protein